MKDVISLKNRFHLVAAAFFFLFACFPSISNADTYYITPFVDIQRGGFVLNRSTGTFDSEIVITNTTGRILLSPVKAVLKIDPKAVFPATGTSQDQDGTTYFDLPLVAGRLEPRESTHFILKLTNTSYQKFAADIAVTAGFQPASPLLRSYFK